MKRLRPAMIATALALSRSPVAAELPRLAGTVVGPGGRTAMLELDRRQFGVMLGDEVVGWVVTSIAPGQVVLSGPGGAVSLSIAAAVEAMTMDVPASAPGWTNPCGRLHGVAGRRDPGGCRKLAAAGRL